MTISEELNKIINSKEAIRQSIINKGTDVGTDVPLSQYASKIDEIQTTPVEYENPDFYEMRTNGGTNFAGLFVRMSGDDIDLTNLDTSKATNFSYLFENCSVKNIDCSGWDTSNVTDMGYMFNNCSSNMDCSGWDTSNVTDMSYAFNTFSGNIDISGWDTSNVTNISNIFNNVPDINKIKEIDALHFPKITSANYVFKSAKGDYLDLSRWNISNITNMNALFQFGYIKRIDLTNWVTTHVTNMGDMFSYNNDIEEIIMPDWDMTNVTNHSNFFSSSSSYNKKLKYIDLSRSNELTITRITSYLPKRTETTFSEISIPTDSSQVIIDALIAKYWRPIGPKLDLTNCTIAVELDEVLLGKTTKICIGSYTPWYGDTEKNIEYVSSDESIATIDSNGNLTTHSLGNVEIYVRLKDTQEVVSNTISVNVVESYTNPNEFKFRTTNNAAPTNYKVNGVSLSSSNCTFNDVSKIWTHVPDGNITLMQNSGSSSCNISDIVKINIENVTNMEKMFNYWSKLTSIDSLSNWNVSNVTSMNTMFNNCSSLTSLDISNWDVSNVTSMGRMFSGCYCLTTLDISNWDVSNVTDMMWMFSGCDCLTTLDISNWDVSNVTIMVNMFNGCDGLTTLDISNWNIIKASLSNIFYSANKLTSIKCNVAVSINKLIPELPDTNGTIYTTCDLSELDLEAISSKGWSVEYIEPVVPIESIIICNHEGYYIFDSSITLESDVDSYQFNAAYRPENTTQIGVRWISDNEDIANIDENGLLTRIGYGDVNITCISTVNPSISTTLMVTLKENTSGGDPSPDNPGDSEPEIPFESNEIRFRTSGSKNLNVNGSNVTGQVTELYTGADGNPVCRYVSNDAITKVEFREVYKFEEDYGDGITVYYEYDNNYDLYEVLYIDNTNITDMSNMFNGCNQLRSIPQMNTQNVTSMKGMFNGCGSLESVPHMDTHNVTDMAHMFYSCYSLRAIPTFDTSKVTDMSSMLDGCSSLESVPDLDTSKVIQMHRMFGGCSSLVTAPQLDTSSATSMYGMFAHCSSLTEPPQINTSKITSAHSMFAGCSSLQSVPVLDLTNVTSVAMLFYQCTNMMGSVDPDVYWNNPKFEEFYTYNGCFEGCYNLDNDIPESWMVYREE